jgi:hypothetical protein
MMQIIDGKRYNTKTGNLIAMQGHEHSDSRGVKLYVTDKGAFFKLEWTHWQGEENAIVVIDQREAFEFFCQNWYDVLSNDEEFEEIRQKYFKEIEVLDA